MFSLLFSLKDDALKTFIYLGHHFTLIQSTPITLFLQKYSRKSMPLSISFVLIISATVR
jgi:hypothetical protein